MKNQESYEIKTLTVKRGDVMPAKIAGYGGHTMIMGPIQPGISSFGAIDSFAIGVS
ncbi:MULTISPECIES: hypothetical protein [unclassified Lentimonas]|uniref:hypothetical protein n=1 Tax=unclassified Lentimonas TaxID=2630993 RepID=UPI0013898B4B|nr:MULTISPECIES: hypothetical protein [unclassified Lentimonas]